MKFTKSDLVDYVIDNTSLKGRAKPNTQEMTRVKALAKEMVEAVFNGVSTVVTQGKTIYVAGFGTFSSNERDARQFTNPRTGQIHELEKRKTIKFKPSRNLKLKAR